MFKSIFLGILAVTLSGSNAFAAKLSSKHANAARNEVVRYFSDEIGDCESETCEKNTVSRSDIWALSIEKDSPQACKIMVTGLVKVMGGWSPSTFQFWVCINETSAGLVTAEVWDTLQIADE